MEEIVKGNTVTFSFDDEAAFRNFRKGLKDSRIWNRFEESKIVATRLNDYRRIGQGNYNSEIILKHGDSFFKLNGKNRRSEVI